MENNSGEQFIMIQAKIEYNKQELKSNQQDYDDKMKNHRRIQINVRRNHGSD